MSFDGVLRRAGGADHPGDRDGSHRTERLGRSLLERQTPGERAAARAIFDRMLGGAKPEDLRDEIGELDRRHRYAARRWRG